MIQRTFFPSRPPTYFRFTMPLPLRVVFPSVTYELTLQSVPAAGRHEVIAHDPERGRWPRVGPAYRTREFLELAAYVAGIPVRPASIEELILRRLVVEGRARRVDPPADDPAARWPGATRCLGSWLNPHEP